MSRALTWKGIGPMIVVQWCEGNTWTISGEHDSYRTVCHSPDSDGGLRNKHIKPRICKIEPP